ncbi:DUF1642 domain-containing protein [Enterococcus faecium]|uniref:DUF1642 domain-containing protein n=1 Tax=Enterococcus faecium TaxID=1352 RepID=UPI000CF33AEE|nr:DUF1642 domain-containing protein [Enterococcus faecium]PQG66002.1 hypothetical protein CUS28_03870 [Enterococcus faecium]
MNKQETIKKLESIKAIGNDAIAACYNESMNAGITLMKKIDEPHKPVVPKFVAEWFEENKDDLDTAIFGYLVFWQERYTDSVLYQWFDKSKNKPIETLIRMKDGYEVEKEPLYRVKIGEGYFVEYQGRGALIMPDCNKEIKIFDSKSDAERTAQTIGGTVEEVEIAESEE